MFEDTLLEEDELYDAIKSVVRRNRRLKMVVEVAERRKMQDRMGVTTVEIALRWLRWHSGLRVGTGKESGGNDGVIIGISKLEHLGENIDGLEGEPLPGEIVEALERMYRGVRAEQKPYWMGELEYGYDTVGSLFGGEEGGG